MLWHRSCCACAACYRFRPADGRFALPDPRLEGEAHVPFPPTKHGLAPRGARCAGAPRRRHPDRRPLSSSAAQCPGTVVDQQGGVVPGVTVTAISRQTSQARSTVTDASGFYSLPQLTPGQYDVTAELDGFKKADRTAVQLDASASVTIGFTLETGALTEVVTVTSDAAGAADRRDAAQDGRGQGHRAALVQRPQPDRRGRPQGRRHRRQLQQLRLLEPEQRRLQHQWQPRRATTTSPSTAPPPSARARRAPRSACRTSTPSRKSRS